MSLYDNQFQQPFTPLTEWTYDGHISNLGTTDSVFHPSDLEEHKVVIPPCGTSIGLQFITDEDYLLPILMQVTPERDIYQQIPSRHNFCRSWVVHIHN